MKWLRSQIEQLFGDGSGTEDIAISGKMENVLSLWVSVYEGGGPWCNSKTGIHSLDLGGSVANELARLATMELEVSLSGSARADYLNSQISPFLDSIQAVVQDGCALGGIVFKPYVAGGSLVIDVVQADCFFPTAFDTSRRMTGAIFSDQIRRKDRIYTRLERHTFQNGTETIENKAFCSSTSATLGSEIALTDVPEWADISPKTEISNLERPLFAYFRVPAANREDRHSALGTSVFAAAVETIHDADEQYGRMLWEYNGGQLAVDADETAIRTGPDGEGSLPQREKRLFRRVISASTRSTQTLYEVFAPALRDENYRRGLDAMFKRIEFQCGLAYGTLSDPQTTDKTAEEVRASKQRSYSTVKAIQTALKNALDDLLYAMDAYATLYRLAPAGGYTATYDFDDSIVNDPAQRKAMFWEYVQAGKYPMARYLQEYEGYSEADATAIVQEAAADEQSNAPLTFAPGDA